MDGFYSLDMRLLSSWDLQNQPCVNDIWEGDLRGLWWLHLAHSWTSNPAYPNLDLSFLLSQRGILLSQSKLVQVKPWKLPSVLTCPETAASSSPGSALPTSCVSALLLSSCPVLSAPHLIPRAVWSPCFPPESPSSTTASKMISVTHGYTLQAWMAPMACQDFLHSFLGQQWSTLCVAGAVMGTRDAEVTDTGHSHRCTLRLVEETGSNPGGILCSGLQGWGPEETPEGLLVHSFPCLQFFSYVKRHTRNWFRKK